MYDNSKTIRVTASISIPVVIELPVSTSRPEKGGQYHEWFVNQLYGMLGRIRQDATVDVCEYDIEVVDVAIGTYTGNGYSQSCLTQYGRDKYTYNAITSVLYSILPTLPEVEEIVRKIDK